MPQPRRCDRCQGQVFPDRQEPGEWYCLACGAITYASKPLPLVQGMRCGPFAEPRQKRR